MEIFLSVQHFEHQYSMFLWNTSSLL